jgi:hypothetical protein
MAPLGMSPGGIDHVTALMQSLTPPSSRGAKNRAYAEDLKAQMAEQLESRRRAKDEYHSRPARSRSSGRAHDHYSKQSVRPVSPPAQRSPPIPAQRRAPSPPAPLEQNGFDHRQGAQHGQDAYAAYLAQHHQPQYASRANVPGHLAYDSPAVARTKEPEQYNAFPDHGGHAAQQQAAPHRQYHTEPSRHAQLRQAAQVHAMTTRSHIARHSRQRLHSTSTHLLRHSTQTSTVAKRGGRVGAQSGTEAQQTPQAC